MRPSRALTWTILTFGALVWVAAACAPRADQPTDVVAAMHAALDAGEFERASRLVDLRYRVAEMLGEVFETAGEEHQEAAVALARQMFFDTTRTHWDPHFQGRPVTTKVSRREGPHVWVESVAQGDGRPEFKWIYRLTPRPNGWRVTQREFRSGPAKSDTTAFYPQAIRHLAGELGRTPTLEELNANLPSLLGRLRARTFTIPELPPRPSP